MFFLISCLHVKELLVKKKNVPGHLSKLLSPIAIFYNMTNLIKILWKFTSKDRKFTTLSNLDQDINLRGISFVPSPGKNHGTISFHVIYQCFKES